MTIIECPTRICPEMPGDLTTYNIQDAIFFNGTALSFTVSCPTGYFCPPGTFPKTFTYPPGTFTIPKPPPNGGNPIILSKPGCSSVVTHALPAGSSEAAQNAAAQQIFQQIGAQQAQCDAIKSLPPGSKVPVAISLTAITQYACVNTPFSATIFASSTPSGAPFTMIVSPQPAWMVTAQNPTSLFLNGTPTTIGVVNFTVTATGTNASGNKTYALNVVGIATASPLPNATDGVLYGESLDASSITGTQVWSVIAGALPVWMSLNTVTGSLSGTPGPGDVGDISNFTIQVTNGAVTCFKSFDVETVADPAGPFKFMTWVPYTLDEAPHSSVIVDAQKNYCNVSGITDGTKVFFGGGVGTLIYTGPAINCRAICNYSSVVPGFTSRILQSTGTIPIINSINVMPVGQTIFLFSLPLSVGGVFTFFGNSLAFPYFYADIATGTFSLVLEVV